MASTLQHAVTIMLLLIAYSHHIATLNDPYNLPPKRLLVTTFIPSAWVDDALIKERKKGLADYLTDVLSSPKYKDQAVLFEFLTAPSSKYDQKFDLEDALPSTLTRTKALTLGSDVNASTVPISGTYYPDWAGSTVPPESIDYSKFDLIYFGTNNLSVLLVIQDD
jgi:chitinase